MEISQEILWLSNIPAELGHTNYNKFFLLDLRNYSHPLNESLIAKLAETVCATPFADDLLILEDANSTDASFRVIGMDQREADFCGNGAIYIAAKLGSETNSKSLRMHSRNGLYTATKLNDHWLTHVDKIETLDIDLDKINKLNVDSSLIVGAIWAGEPHLILKPPKGFKNNTPSQKEFEAFSAPYRDCLGMSGGVNVTMIMDEGPDKSGSGIQIRTFERGVSRQTASCGSGAIAAAATLLGLDWNGSIKVSSPGGSHQIQNAMNGWTLSAKPHQIVTGKCGELIDLSPLSRPKTDHESVSSSDT